MPILWCLPGYALLELRVFLWQSNQIRFWINFVIASRKFFLCKSLLIKRTCWSSLLPLCVGMAVFLHCLVRCPCVLHPLCVGMTVILNFIWSGVLVYQSETLRRFNSDTVYTVWSDVVSHIGTARLPATLFTPWWLVYIHWKKKNIPAWNMSNHSDFFFLFNGQIPSK